jgi:hypothetical protein
MLGCYRFDAHVVTRVHGLFASFASLTQGLLLLSFGSRGGAFGTGGRGRRGWICLSGGPLGGVV